MLKIGKVKWREFDDVFGIKDDDRRRHCYVCGQTGTGKSTLLENMIIQDINEGKGVCVADPHGELAEKILASVPKWRTNEVIYVNPSDLRYPISFNPLEQVDEDKKAIVVSGMMSVFEKIFFNGSGFSQAPQLTHILRHCLYAVMDYPQSTLLSVKQMLVDDAFRADVIKYIKDPIIRDFWVKEFPEKIMKRRDDPLASTLNKLGQFLTVPMLRNIIGQSKSSFDLRKIMDEGKILIVNLSKGKLGEDSASLLGAMLVTKIYLTAMSRVDTPEASRKDFFLYCDEFQNFSTNSFASILSEARKYHLCLILANQYIKQLEEPIRDAIFGNVGTVITFRCGVDDAEFLEKYYDEDFRVGDIINLPKHAIYLKLLIDGLPSKPFSAVTLQPLAVSNSNVANIVKQSRIRYCRRLTSH